MPDRIELPPLRRPSSFDWNDQNEREHIAKHGIRFGFAIGIFLDPMRIETIDLRRDYGELRYNVVGLLDGTYLNVTFTMRGATAWVISARRAERSVGLMTIVRKTLEEIRANPPKLTPEERARLEAMSDEEIERNAESDPDNPPLSNEQLDRMVFARDVRLAREKTGLSQAKFAARFRINPTRLRDWEQGRFQPDSVARAYIRVIARETEAVERALSD